MSLASPTIMAPAFCGTRTRHYLTSSSNSEISTETPSLGIENCAIIHVAALVVGAAIKVAAPIKFGATKTVRSDVSNVNVLRLTTRGRKGQYRIAQ